MRNLLPGSPATVTGLHTHMSAGQLGLEPRSLVLETNILPIKLLTYTRTIHHIRTVPMSPKLYFFTIMP